jgi:hypothetical protein
MAFSWGVFALEQSKLAACAGPLASNRRTHQLFRITKILPDINQTASYLHHGLLGVQSQYRPGKP